MSYKSHNSSHPLSQVVHLWCFVLFRFVLLPYFLAGRPLGRLLSEGHEVLGPEYGTEQHAGQCSATAGELRARLAAWLLWNPDTTRTVLHMDLLVFSVESTRGVGAPEMSPM